jgi:hypothetical protein
MYITEAIGNILEEKIDLMRENFRAALTEKAIQSLEEKKIEIAESYFGFSKPEKTEEE